MHRSRRMTVYSLIQSNLQDGKVILIPLKNPSKKKEYSTQNIRKYPKEFQQQVKGWDIDYNYLIFYVYI